MIRNEQNAREISKEEMGKITGGYVIKVNPKDVEGEKLDLKKYWVVESESGKILNSFDKYEDAVAADAIAHSDKAYIYNVPEGGLHGHVFKSLDGDSLVWKPW